MGGALVLRLRSGTGPERVQDLDLLDVRDDGFVELEWKGQGSGSEHRSMTMPPSP
ncbi:MAG: hypothetical protein MUC62_04900 [Candidatus Thermoplasmatota archaeon]|nr:hypothetical protein [Candidatus Thermoplasmatota archaeon]